MKFYIDVKEMTAFVSGNFTNVMRAVFASLKSRTGKQVGVRHEQQSCSYYFVMCLEIFLLDPSCFLIVEGLAWQLALKSTMYKVTV